MSSPRYRTTILLGTFSNPESQGELLTRFSSSRNQ